MAYQDRIKKSKLIMQIHTVERGDMLMNRLEVIHNIRSTCVRDQQNETDHLCLN